MNAEFWNTAAHVSAIFAGVFFGSAAVSTASWVWLRKQVFAYGGSALCGAGVVLVGLSIWHSVDFGVTGAGLSLKVQASLEQKFQADLDAKQAAFEAKLLEDQTAYFSSISKLKDNVVNQLQQTQATLDDQMRLHAQKYYQTGFPYLPPVVRPDATAPQPIGGATR